MVDHAEEGILGEIFCAALQSAAFVESNTEKLIEIGLSYIPQDSFVARTVKTAQDCYSNGTDIIETRKLIHNTAPGTFGFEFIAGSVSDPRLEFIVSCTLEGRHSNENVKVTMLRKN